MVRGGGDAEMETVGMRLSLRSYPERGGTHVHGFQQVVLPVDGAMDIRIGDASGSVSGRRGVFIGGGARHVFQVSGASRFIVLDMLPGTSPPTTPRSPFFAFDESLAELTCYAARELMSGGLDAEGEIHLAALIAGKIRRFFARPPRWPGPVERALALMRERHAERLSIAAVAREAGLGASRFHELFRHETGRTPGEMLAEIRLDRAEMLLERTRLPIAEIALRVGFSEQSALTRSLRRRRATTPGAFRRGRIA